MQQQKLGRVSQRTRGLLLNYYYLLLLRRTGWRLEWFVESRCGFPSIFRYTRPGQDSVREVVAKFWGKEMEMISNTEFMLQMLLCFREQTGFPPDF